MLIVHKKNVCDCWNKEHSVPQSWFSKASPMKSDLFHVYPTDSRVNNFRNNYAYGETSSTAYVAGDSHSLGRIGSSNFSGYTSTVYEPDDEFKGDLARTYFYMATRYADKCSNWSGGMFGSNYNGLNTYARNLLLKWHRDDPVSAKETQRNDGIYVHQHNRNPFIDYPELAEHIWGDKKGENWYETSTPVEQVTFANLQVYPNPANQVVSVTADGVDQFTYTIFDISGQLLLSGSAKSNDLIAISQLNSGMYLFQIDANSKKQVMKLVVTK
ncbi:MAG: endonuclease [Paludibacteraceae bacterium]|nr:endonuclease [Paludibacteraceae bacterium]